MLTIRNLNEGADEENEDTNMAKEMDKDASKDKVGENNENLIYKRIKYALC